MKEKNLNAILDIGNKYTKLLIDFNKNKSGSHLEGYIIETNGLTRGQIINKEKLKKTIKKIIKSAEQDYKAHILNIDFVHKPYELSYITRKKEISNKNKKGKTIFSIGQLEECFDKIANNILEKNSDYKNFELLELDLLSDNIKIRPEYEKGADISFYKDLIIYYCVIFYSNITEKFILEAIEGEAAIDKTNGQKIHPVTEYTLLTEEQKDEGIILIDIGHEYSLISFFKEGKLIKTFNIKSGGNNITTIIAINEKIEPNEAEKRKINYSNDLSFELNKKTKAAINVGIKEFSKELLTKIKEEDNIELFPQGIVLIGGGALFRNIDNDIENYTNILTKKLQTKTGITSSEHINDLIWLPHLFKASFSKRGRG